VSRFSKHLTVSCLSAETGRPAGRSNLFRPVFLAVGAMISEAETVRPDTVSIRVRNQADWRRDGSRGQERKRGQFRYQSHLESTELKLRTLGATTKVFISWSGEQSKKMAEALRSWLEYVIQSTDPFASSLNIVRTTEVSRSLPASSSRPSSVSCA
jgi:hypothetical protein